MGVTPGILETLDLRNQQAIAEYWTHVEFLGRWVWSKSVSAGSSRRSRFLATPFQPSAANSLTVVWSGVGVGGHGFARGVIADRLPITSQHQLRRVAPSVACCC